MREVGQEPQAGDDHVLNTIAKLAKKKIVVVQCMLYQLREPFQFSFCYMHVFAQIVCFHKNMNVLQFLKIKCR